MCGAKRTCTCVVDVGLSSLELHPVLPSCHALVLSVCCELRPTFQSLLAFFRPELLRVCCSLYVNSRVADAQVVTYIQREDFALGLAERFSCLLLNQ